MESSRNFANKIWNASRFALMNLDLEKIELPAELEHSDKWILSKYNRLVREVTENLEKYEIGIAVSKLYDFIWDDLCDWYIELSKPRLFESCEDMASKSAAQNTLAFVLSGTMQLLHPIMPFITEEIYLSLPHAAESVMISDWPQADPALDFAEAEAQMEQLMGLIKAVRAVRAEMNIPPSRKASLYIETEDEALFSGQDPFFARLASTSELHINLPAPENAVAVVADGVRAKIPLGELVDFEKERARLQKEREKCLLEIERVKKKLANESFVSKAPEAVVAAEREKQTKQEAMLAKIDESLAALQ